MRTLLLLVFTLLYFIGAHWFYTQKISGICCNDATATTSSGIEVPEIIDQPVIDNTAISASDVGPISFNWSDEAAMTSDDFEDYKSSILRNRTENNILEITGQYNNAWPPRSCRL